MACNKDRPGCDGLNNDEEEFEDDGSPPPSKVVWWGGEESQDGPDADDPTSDSGEGRPTLTGEVHTISNDEGGVLGVSGDDDKGISNWAWFFIGLLLAPLALGIVSGISAMVAESLGGPDWAYGHDSFLINRESVYFDGEEFYVFEADFGDDVCCIDDSDYYTIGIYWEAKTEPHDTHECFLDSWKSRTGSFDYNNEVVDDEGRDWGVMGCNDWQDGPQMDAYARLEGGSKISFASENSATPDESWVDAEYEGGSDELADLLMFISFAIWPVGLIAGLIWGFTKGHRWFAYGMLAAIVVLPAACFAGMMILVLLLWGW